MPRQRLDQVDAMRPMKQAGVISTHVLTYFVPAAAIVSTNAVMLLTHFSREGFFFISACMLTYAYMDLDRGGLRRFYGRRALAVTLPYLCWSVIYFLYLLPTAHYASTAVALENFAKELATGYYQLYFLLIIMQYYLVFPLLMAFLRRTRDHHGAIVVIALLGHVALMTLMHWSVVPVLRTGWIREFTPYAFYLIAGSIAAFHLEAVNEWLVRHAGLVIALTVAAALGAEAVYFLAANGVTTALGSGNDPFQPSVIPFDIGAIACLYLLGVVLVKPGRSRRLRAAVRSGSDNSYGVYLSQMLFINALIWAGWARLDSVVWWPLLCAATVVIVFLAGVALTSLLARTPLAVPLTGRQQQPWATWWPRSTAGPANDTAVGGRRPEPVAAGTPEPPIAFRTSATGAVSPLIKRRPGNVNRERALTASCGSASRRTAGGALAGGPENPRKKSGAVPDSAPARSCSAAGPTSSLPELGESRADGAAAGLQARERRFLACTEGTSPRRDTVRQSYLRRFLGAR